MNLLIFSNKFIQYIKQIVRLEILIFLIVILLSIYSYIQIFTDNLFSEYSFNELFINYQAGLIRRGLLGELFWQLDKHFSINPKFFFGSIIFIANLLQIYFMYFICKNFKNFNLLIILILFSPQLLLFTIYDENIYFLKDIFVKFTIFFHGYLVLKFNEENYIKLLKKVLIPLITIVIFIHEYQVLFISIHILITINFLNSNNRLRNILKFYLYLIIPTLLIFVFIGNEDQYDQLNNILKIYNVQIHPQLGGGFINLIGGFYKWHFFYFSYQDFINLFLSIFLSIIVPFIIFKNLIFEGVIILNRKIKNHYWIFFIPSLICFFALDHGRNISLIATHIFIFFMTLSVNKKKLSRLCYKTHENFNKNIFFIIFVFFYIFLWELDQYAGFALQGKETTIFKSSLFAEFNKLIKFFYNFVDNNIFQLPNI